MVTSIARHPRGIFSVSPPVVEVQKCMFTSESSSCVLRQIKTIFELTEGNPRNSVYDLNWTRLGKGSG
jgi:hypothetical protein